MSRSALRSGTSSPAVCRAPFYGPRLRSKEPLLPDAIPYAPPHRCRSWRCSGCALLKAKDARVLARVGVLVGLAANEPLIMLTLTEPPKARPFATSSRALTAFMKRLQHHYGGGLRWFAVAEWQQRGAVHWHCLVFGLAYCVAATNTKTGRRYPGHPRQVHRWEVTKWGTLRPLALRYGFGPVLDVHAVGVGSGAYDAAEEVALYVAKYLTEVADAHRLPKGARLVRTSRGRNQWVPGLSLTSLAEAAKQAARRRGSTPSPWAGAAVDAVVLPQPPLTAEETARLRVWESCRDRLQRQWAAQERVR